MQFYFIRHGQSENNALWDRQGPLDERSPDPELTELGHRQAQHLARFLAERCVPCEPGERGGYKDAAPRAGPDDTDSASAIRLTHLYCSPMIRCIETAAYLSRALGLPFAVWEQAHEVGGIFYDDEETGQQIGLPGNDRDALLARYPDLILPEGWGAGGWWNRPFEERVQRIPRAQRFHRDLLRRHGETDDCVAVVSHAGFFNYWMMVALDWPRREGIGFRKNNTALTRVDLGGHTTVVYVNRTDHLPGELLS